LVLRSGIVGSGNKLASRLERLAMKKGDKVEWNWGKSQASGTIEKKHVEPVKKTIKGTAVKRNASKENPAYEISMEAGKKVLKSESELKTDK
jgi:hypothetical protein